jgi:hypothetical protein
MLESCDKMQSPQAHRKRIYRPERFFMTQVSFRELVRQELSSTTFCCYCLEVQGDKWHCCQENHFVPFGDLYPEDQEGILDYEMDEYEGANK